MTKEGGKCPPGCIILKSNASADSSLRKKSIFLMAVVESSIWDIWDGEITFTRFAPGFTCSSDYAE